MRHTHILRTLKKGKVRHLNLRKDRRRGCTIVGRRRRRHKSFKVPPDREREKPPPPTHPLPPESGEKGKSFGVGMKSRALENKMYRNHKLEHSKYIIILLLFC